MRLNTLAATAAIAVLALTATACKSSSHASGGPTPAKNPPATETQADSPEATTSVSASPSTAAASASTPPSASPSSSAPAAPSAAGGELNACSLLTGAQASSLTGRQYGAGTPSTIAPGQDQCDYPYSGAGVDLVVIVYEPSSGVSWETMSAVLSGVGTVQQVSGVGDKAMFAAIDLDVATGKYLIDISAAGGDGDDTGAIAIAKQLVVELASK